MRIFKKSLPKNRKLSRKILPWLRNQFPERHGLRITRLEKLADGWESDNHLLEVIYGEGQQAQWVWRVYTGSGDAHKAAVEFESMRKLKAAGYPVPQVHLLAVEDPPLGRPFIIMDYIPGQVLWPMLKHSNQTESRVLFERFSQLFVQLHQLDWRLFDESIPKDEPFFLIDRWLEGAKAALRQFSGMDASSLFDWASERRDLFACLHPAPIHQDFHPANVIVKPDGGMVVIDWTNFTVSDARIDLAWTLVLGNAYGGMELREQILQGYQQALGKPVENIEVFEVLACARRLFDLTISLTRDPKLLGMNAASAEAMRADMEPHRNVYRRFVELSGLHMDAFASLFG